MSENKGTVTLDLDRYESIRKELRDSKSEINSLKRENDRLYKFIKKLGIPAEIVEISNTEDIMLAVFY